MPPTFSTGQRRNERIPKLATIMHFSMLPGAAADAAPDRFGEGRMENTRIRCGSRRCKLERLHAALRKLYLITERANGYCFKNSANGIQ